MCDRALAMVNWAETADLDALEAFTQRDMQMCTETEQPWISWSWSWLAVAGFYRGDWKAALAHSQQAAALSPATVVNGAEWALNLEYCGYEGRRQEALAMISARKSELPRLGERCGWGRWAILWGALESLVVLDEREAAAELYPLVRWCAECTGSMMVMQPDCRLLERGAGMASAAGADWDVAEAHFIAALQQAETLPHRPEQAHTRRFYAAMLLERDRPGDRDAAALLLGEARDLYRGMEMPRHCRLVDDLLDAS
jgi:tetratricopeptide (TPR) repeat protein